jgi:outer membrane protein TolC
MEKNKIVKFIAFFISTYFYVFLCSPIFSQDSLYNYLEIAAKNNPVVLQKFSEYQASLQKVPQVGGLPDPELTMGVFLSPMELVAGNQVADIRLMQMFPWFGVLKNAKDEMSLMAKAKYESFRDAKLQVFYDVQRTWYDLYKIQQDIHISEKNLEILQTLERLTLVKYKAVSTEGSNASLSGSNMSGSYSQNAGSSVSGMGNNMGSSSNNNQSSVNNNQSVPMGSTSSSTGLVDLYRIQIEIGDLENNIALLKNQQSTILARFNTYLGRPVESLVSLPDTLKPDTLEISILTVPDSILTNSPMLGMLQYEQQALDAREKMVTRMGYPMIGIGVDYSVINSSNMSTSSMNGKDMIMPMMTVTLPIYRKKYRAMQSETNLSKTATEQAYKATANSLQAEYYDAIQLYQDAERRIKLYEHQSVLAKKSLDIITASFSASGADLTDILRIRQQTLDFEFKQVEAVVDFNTAIAWLKRLGNLEMQN